MDFIERFFGIAPDGGDGSLEVLYLFAFVVVTGAVIFHRRLRHWLAMHRNNAPRA